MPTIHADISMVSNSIAPTVPSQRRLSRGVGLIMAAAVSATVWVGVLALVSLIF